jgi:hypothetical protein
VLFELLELEVERLELVDLELELDDELVDFVELLDELEDELDVVAAATKVILVPLSANTNL